MAPSKMKFLLDQLLPSPFPKFSIFYTKLLPRSAQLGGDLQLRKRAPF